MQIDHVELFVPDRREAARWYRDVLGLEVLEDYREWEDDPRGPLMISSDGGTTKLALFTGDPQRQKPTAGFHLVAFRLDAGEFLAFLDRLSSLALLDHRGRSVTRELAVDHDKAFSLYFSDPWGHRLELTTYEHEPVRAALA
jgi:catechol 2,3-dioxygenase-like lactoylglutathione lyase family enzyme